MFSWIDSSAAIVAGTAAEFEKKYVMSHPVLDIFIDCLFLVICFNINDFL